MVADEQIEEILRAGDNASYIANNLVDAAIANGGKDNVSVVVCKVL